MSIEFTADEKIALKQFRENVKDTLKDLDAYDSHDVNLIRFLRAREFDMIKAEDMYRKQLEWRVTSGASRCAKIPISEFLLEKLPITAFKQDNDGTIVSLIPFGSWDAKTLLEAGHKEDMTMYVMQVIEKATEYMKNTRTEKRIETQFVMICDYEGFSLTQVLSRQVVSFWVDIFRMYEAAYPEKMKACYVINAPKVFEIFWPMLNHVLAAHTLQKVKIFGNNTEKWRKFLTEVIPYQELPSRYGGSNTVHPWYKESMGEEFPARAPNLSSEEMLTRVVGAGDKFQLTFHLKKGNRIIWHFKTDNYNLGFQFLRDEVPMYPYSKCDSHIYLQDGLVDIANNGVYALVFDNSYSKYRAKTLYYVVQVQDSPVVMAKRK